MSIKNAVIIHGKPSKEEYMDLANPAQSNRHWFPWLQKQLAIRGVIAQSLEMPEPYEPRYEKWKEVFEQIHVTQDTALIGHSCGGGFFVRWLSEEKRNVGPVVLVAPWIDTEKELQTGFFDFTIDPTLSDRTEHTTVMYSTDDDPSIQETVRVLREKIPGATYKEFHDKGHFCTEDLVDNAFPEILDVLGYQETK